MAAGRKRQRHVGREYGITEVHGLGDVYLDGIAVPSADLIPNRYTWNGPEHLADKCPTPVEMITPLTPTQTETVGKWCAEYPDQAEFLGQLRVCEPERFLKALESIRNGRGSDVADALLPWYVDYRSKRSEW